MTEPSNEATKSAFNTRAAERLREAADLLALQDDNPFRVAAYRRAADAVAGRREDVRDLLAAGGVDALKQIPGVGDHIARGLAELARSGRWIYLERLRGSAEPADVFCAIPGVGPALARRLHETLHVDTLEQLEAALSDESRSVAGVGRRRRAALRASLAQMLTRLRPYRSAAIDEPSVEDLLDVDREYRSKAQAGKLKTIAPRRFNPQGEAWLPILHTERGAWKFTALFSNTARAHELDKVRDWVVIYFHSDDGAEAQRTVVTAMRGPLAGRRVVRGREEECLSHYESLAPPERPGASAKARA
jgi:predicted flap endonuclease-1-like 5' DNA nuclease